MHLSAKTKQNKTKQNKNKKTNKKTNKTKKPRLISFQEHNLSLTQQPKIKLNKQLNTKTNP